MSETNERIDCIVGPQVTKEVLGVLNGEAMLERWNDPTIALILKVHCPEKVTDVRPISFCNVVYVKFLQIG